MQQYSRARRDRRDMGIEFCTQDTKNSYCIMGPLFLFTHTHTHTHTHARTHARTHAFTHKHTHMHTHTHARTHARTNTNTHTHIHTNTHTHTHSCTLLLFTHTHARTHARTHTVTPAREHARELLLVQNREGKNSKYAKKRIIDSGRAVSVVTRAEKSAAAA